MFHKKDKYFPFATLVLIGILIITTGCRHQTQQLQTVIDGYAQGGTYHIVLVGDSTSNGLKPQIDSILNQIDNSLSLYNPQSLLCRINRGETDTLDHLITSCIRLADSISRESDGRYDITIGPLTAAYGFAGGKPTQNPNIDSLLERVGYQKLSIEQGHLKKQHPDMRIDLNSIAQGATVDCLARWLDSLGKTNYLIELGGEIFARGCNAQGMPWRVGIDKPIEGNMNRPYCRCPNRPTRSEQSAFGYGGGPLVGSSRRLWNVVHDSRPRREHPIPERTSRATSLFGVVRRTGRLPNLYDSWYGNLDPRIGHSTNTNRCNSQKTNFNTYKTNLYNSY